MQFIYFNGANGGVGSMVEWRWGWGKGPFNVIIRVLG